MLKKFKIYLDTSVVSYLDQQDAPEKMVQTLEFWKVLETGKYEIILGSNVFEELRGCNQEKEERLLQLLDRIKYVRADVNEERFYGKRIN